jgi:hypothetical protein
MSALYAADTQPHEMSDASESGNGAFRGEAIRTVESSEEVLREGILQARPVIEDRLCNGQSCTLGLLAKQTKKLVRVLRARARYQEVDSTCQANLGPTT